MSTSTNFLSFDNSTANYTKNGCAIVLDNTAHLYDANFASQGNYNGASITLSRHGGASVSDVFSASGNLIFNGNNAFVCGVNIGSIRNYNGILSINFNSNATQAYVNSAINSIAYNNASAYPPDSYQIDYTFKEGNSGNLTAVSTAAVTVQVLSDKGVSATSYNAATGVLSISGTHLTGSAADYHFAGLTLTGDQGRSYTLTSSSITSVSPGYGTVAIQLSADAQLALTAVLDNSGVVGNDKISAYNLSVATGWDTGALAISKAVSVSNANTSASISGISFDGSSGTLTLNGAHFSIMASDYHASALSFHDDDGNQYNLTNGSVVTGSPSSTQVSFHLSVTDQNGLNRLFSMADDDANDSDEGFVFSTGANWTLHGTAVNTHNVSINNLSIPPVPAGNNVTTLVNGLTGLSDVESDGNGNVFYLNNNHLFKIAAGSHTVSDLSVQTTHIAIGDMGEVSYTSTNGNIYNLGNNAPIFTGSATSITREHDTDGDVFYTSNGQIYELGQSIPYPTHGVTDFQVDKHENIYFIDSRNGNIDSMINWVQHTIYSGNASSLALDSNSNVYFTDATNHAIKEISTSNGTVSISTLLSNVQATDLTVDGHGNIYFTDTQNNAIEEINHSMYLADMHTPVAVSNLIENTGQIELSKAVFTDFVWNNSVDSCNFSNASSATGVNDYLFYNANNGGVYYADHGSAAGSSVTEIAVIGVNNHPATLSAGDFSLIA